MILPQEPLVSRNEQSPDFNPLFHLVGIVERKHPDSVDAHPFTPRRIPAFDCIIDLAKRRGCFLPAPLPLQGHYALEQCSNVELRSSATPTSRRVSTAARISFSASL